ncbi:sure-like protein [Dichomitus squalens]|uniref:Sure-like protein n=1 Tax=Dichomitus squalens TaxID=114155 RepID=A0A4Q9MVE2_9APHY|nr:sure-like protein [Dichomitus squalens]
MQHWDYLISILSVSVLFQCVSAHNILLTNDDGWAVAQIRAQRDSLVNGGFNVILSSPAVDKSSTGSDTATPKPLAQPCEFNSCPKGSPAEGFNASDPRLNYVNAFPADAVHYGIQTLSPKFFGTPDFVISGPNIGNNLGANHQGSGTINAACEAAKEGIPSAAVSGDIPGQGHVSYTTLTTSPKSPTTLTALLYAELTTNFTQTMYNPAARPILPANVTLNINYGATTFSASGEPKGKCATASDFKWVFTRMAKSTTAVDVETCGSKHLPDERTVIDAGCYASVAVMNANTKKDVSASVQAQVLDRLAPSGLFTCFKG